MALNGTWLTQFPIKPCGSVNFRVIQRSAAISAMSAFCKILLPCIRKFSYKPLLLPKRCKEIKLRVTTLPVFFFLNWMIPLQPKNTKKVRQNCNDRLRFEKKQLSLRVFHLKFPSESGADRS